jgi:outer membrane protein assembly factor BamE (lipoprotein component of BamABCDE complex)
MTATTHMFRVCTALLLSMVLSACSTTLGRDFNDEYAQQIKSGETTKEEVVARLGRPSLRKGTKDEEVWTYAYYTGPGAIRFLYINNATEEAQYGRGNQKRLVVTFSGANEQRIDVGVSRKGSVLRVRSGGIVLAGTFSTLAVLPLVFLTEIGFVVAFGVLLDTFLVRSILVPAIALTSGDDFWWPSALSRRES